MLKYFVESSLNDAYLSNALNVLLLFFRFLIVNS